MQCLMMFNVTIIRYSSVESHPFYDPSNELLIDTNSQSIKTCVHGYKRRDLVEVEGMITALASLGHNHGDNQS